MRASFLQVFLILIALSANPAERRANISYSRQMIRIIHEVDVLGQDSLNQIIFLHIPKTAGTNVDYIIKTFSKLMNNFHYQRLVIPRTSTSHSPQIITEGWIGGWQQIVSNPHVLDTSQDSLFLTGHFPYGLHKYFHPSAKYITLIRNPLEREMSIVNFAYQRGYIQIEEALPYLFEKMLDNPQVRLIAGVESMTGLCTEETLVRAMQNIERDFVLAAPSEEVDTFLQLLASFQKWGTFAYAPMQITHKKAVKSFDSLVMGALLQKHRYDIRFYEWIKQRWDTYKKEIIVCQKQVSPQQTLLTLMPDYLSIRQPQWLTIKDIETHNRVFSERDLLELTQSGSTASNQ